MMSRHEDIWANSLSPSSTMTRHPPPRPPSEVPSVHLFSRYPAPCHTSYAAGWCSYSRIPPLSSQPRTQSSFTKYRVGHATDISLFLRLLLVGLGWNVKVHTSASVNNSRLSKQLKYFIDPPVIFYSLYLSFFVSQVA